eukprot:TRINITY_DN12694_c0_g1_i2.p2 TRINITY_DN12694_c0_g1~~TRINITY_DN12694_c0_g1_i2.p2  ORF type:complete len:160 (+),score=17.98 TRINITY_DN12694_c0_g1_i2:3-482(+)
MRQLVGYGKNEPPGEVDSPGGVFGLAGPGTAIRRSRPASPAGSVDQTKVLRGHLAVAATNEFIFHLLTFVESGDTGSLKGRDVDERVFAAVFRRDETVTFLTTEPFDGADRHAPLLRGLIHTAPGKPGRTFPILRGKQKASKLGRAHRNTGIRSSDNPD